jgi:hypothetical protein
MTESEANVVTKLLTALLTKYRNQLENISTDGEYCAAYIGALAFLHLVKSEFDHSLEMDLEDDEIENFHQEMNELAVKIAGETLDRVSKITSN